MDFHSKPQGSLWATGAWSGALRAYSSFSSTSRINISSKNSNSKSMIIVLIGRIVTVRV